MASIDNVLDISPRVQYTAGVSQTIFAYPFAIFVDADLVVDVDGVIKVLTTDYTVSGAGNDNGGDVTLLIALAGGETVTIYRDIAVARLTDFQQNGPWSSVTFNDELDKLYLVMQELENKVGRAIRFPITSLSTNAEAEMAPIANFFNKFLRVSSTGILEAVAVTNSEIVTNADVINILDTAGFYVGTDVELALAEVGPAVAAIRGAFVVESAGFSIVNADLGKTFNVDTGSATVSLPAVATVGDGFWVIITNTSGSLVTLDGNGSEKIDIGLGPNNTQTLDIAQSILLKTNGVKWFGILINSSEQTKSATNKSWTSDIILADITGLTGFDLLANGEYEFEAYLDGTQDGGNFEWRFDASIAVISGSYMWWANDNAGVGAQGHNGSIEGNESFTTLTDAQNFGVYIKGRLLAGATDGTFKMEGRQENTDPQATTIFGTSFMRVKRIL